ncbi:hypothetical protein MMC14_002520 [Varicellaria rhodocarpa]|nr:hypothetical protein [Varicellaria rhodocarpa]
MSLQGQTPSGKDKTSSLLFRSSTIKHSFLNFYDSVNPRNSKHPPNITLLSNLRNPRTKMCYDQKTYYKCACLLSEGLRECDEVLSGKECLRYVTISIWEADNCPQHEEYASTVAPSESSNNMSMDGTTENDNLGSEAFDESEYEQLEYDEEELVAFEVASGDHDDGDFDEDDAANQRQVLLEMNEDLEDML